MEKISIYQELGRYINIFAQHTKNSNSVSDIICENCVEKAEDIVKNHFPNGSGFDSGTSLVWDKCKYNKIVLRADFHHMDDNGYYCGWSEHEVIIVPSFSFGYDLRVTGKDKRGIKDYIEDTFHYVLQKEVD